jgi:uracil phosphoribosyltransferase
MSGATTANSQSNPAAIPPNVITLRQTAQLEALYTIIRDQHTSRGDFIFYSDRIIRLLVRPSTRLSFAVPLRCRGRVLRASC